MMPENEIDWLMPEPRHAYYLVTQRYTRMSAGVKAMHLLCHALNRAGERAYLITYPHYMPDYAINPEWITPHLTHHVLMSDFERKLCPITIYPEVISGNPYDAPLVVRYAMNFAGHLGGDREFSRDELCIAYSEAIAGTLPQSIATMFIPASDPRVFAADPQTARKGTCFYAGKYKGVHGGALSDITRDSIEITRFRRNSQTPEELADLFRRSELFYTYENTALAIEALLCGCPVVFIPNPHLSRVIAERELGWDGVAWGCDENEIERAKRTIGKAREKYLSTFTLFRSQLDGFVRKTQDAAKNRTYDTPMKVPHLRPPGLMGKAEAAWIKYAWLVKSEGFMRSLARTVERIRVRGFQLIDK